MVVTDMVSANGWNSNRAMVLLKSTNLIDWTSTVINIPNTYLAYAAADRIWAPQTIYDPVEGKYMVYFAMRLGSSDYDKIYYAYVNSTFTGFEAAPALLLNNPGLAAIDADIVYNDGLYQLFFKTEGNGNGIKKAVSPTLTSGYVINDKYLQSTTNAVEGGCVFRMYNTDTWMLIYDMYTSGAYQFTESTDLLNFSVVPNTVSFDFTPRHGTIIPITVAELNALNAKWNPTTVNTEKENNGSFSISPVPAKDILTVNLNEAGNSNTTAIIYDAAGRKVLQQKLPQQRNQINLTSLKKGIYMIKCVNDGALIGSLRFVVQ
jgi:hypothetical protein